MSTFSLTKGSAAALGMLASQAGSETLLLTQPARELRAELSIEPFTSDSGDQLLAVLFMREQRHSMTLQRNDGANVQHLADWVEAVANGTLDTAQAIPQRQPVLLPCCRCEGVAIAYRYLAPAPALHCLHGVKCRHRDCQSLEGAATAAAAADAWNDIQREELAEAAEPAPAPDETEPVYQFQWREIGEGDWMACSHSWFRFCEASPELDTRVVEVDRPAQTGQQPAYVECRECTDCGHVGINDAHQTDATCAMCDWSGPSPVEDQCPGCGKENAMGAACPKCSGRYRILAETHVAAPIAQTEQQPSNPALVADLYEIGGKLLEIAHTKTKAVSTTLMAPHRDYTLKDARATALVMGERLVGMADRLVRAAPIAQTEQQPVAWLIDWPEDPELGHYFSGVPNEHARSRPLYTDPIAQTAPDGWQLVPMEPTQAMREAFHAATERYEDGYGESPDSQWHAMLRAARATSPTA